MDNEIKNIKINNLPLTESGRLKVELVPMPSGDNPWRTRGEYEKEKNKDNVKFIVTIISLIISIVGMVATSAVAITTIRNMAK